MFPVISTVLSSLEPVDDCVVVCRAIRHLDGKEYRGRPLVVEESRARPPNSTKVFVGNISATCSADDLHGLFASFGRVLDCDKVKGESEIQDYRSSVLVLKQDRQGLLVNIKCSLNCKMLLNV